ELEAAAMQSSIGALCQGDPAGRLAAVEDTQMHAAARLGQLKRRAEAAMHLCAIISAIRAEARNRLTATARKCIHPYLRICFPTSEIDLSDKGWGVNGLRTTGAGIGEVRAEQFTSLSKCAQPQF